MWRAVRALVRRLARAHPEIQRVLVFGSFARDRTVPGSDVDLLVILSEARERFLDRILRLLPDRFPVGVDVFPYTRAEVDRMVSAGNPFLRRALDEGIQVHPGRAPRPGGPRARPVSVTRRAPPR